MMTAWYAADAAYSPTGDIKASHAAAATGSVGAVGIVTSIADGAEPDPVGGAAGDVDALTADGGLDAAAVVGELELQAVKLSASVTAAAVAAVIRERFMVNSFLVSGESQAYPDASPLGDDDNRTRALVPDEIRDLECPVRSVAWSRWQQRLPPGVCSRGARSAASVQAADRTTICNSLSTSVLDRIFIKGRAPNWLRRDMGDAGSTNFSRWDL